MTANYSTSVGTTPTMIVPAANRQRDFLSITNVGASGGGTAILSNFSATPAAATPGSYALLPGQSVVYDGSYVPAGPIYAIASSGTVPITIEASVE